MSAARTAGVALGRVALAVLVTVAVLLIAGALSRGLRYALSPPDLGMHRALASGMAIECTAGADWSTPCDVIAAEVPRPTPAQDRRQSPKRPRPEGPRSGDRQVHPNTIATE